MFVCWPGVVWVGRAVECCEPDPCDGLGHFRYVASFRSPEPFDQQRRVHAVERRRDRACWKGRDQTPCLVLLDARGHSIIEALEERRPCRLEPRVERGGVRHRPQDRSLRVADLDQGPKAPLQQQHRIALLGEPRGRGAHDVVPQAPQQRFQEIVKVMEILVEGRSAGACSRHDLGYRDLSKRPRAQELEGRVENGLARPLGFPRAGSAQVPAIGWRNF